MSPYTFTLNPISLRQRLKDNARSCVLRARAERLAGRHPRRVACRLAEAAYHRREAQTRGRGA